MGLFSIYTGLIYNDIFSKTINIFGSKWRNVYNESTLLGNKDLEMDPEEAYLETPYVFGIDPAWMVKKKKKNDNYLKVIAKLC
jgi:V-type H+-transporting ATPase subunit a